MSKCIILTLALILFCFMSCENPTISVVPGHDPELKDSTWSYQGEMFLFYYQFNADGTGIVESLGLKEPKPFSWSTLDGSLFLNIEGERNQVLIYSLWGTAPSRSLLIDIGLNSMEFLETSLPATASPLN